MTKQHPDIKFAVTDSVLGFWSTEQEKFIPFARLTITGKWYFVDRDILVNGKPIERKWEPI